jgi:hypothetical protein
VLETLLRTLATSGVDFIVVGGLAAVAQGAPIVTHDVDIVHRRSPENIDKLLATLLAIDARYRGRAQADVVRPTVAILAGPGHSLLQTALGPLDVLGAIEGGRDYDALHPHAIPIDFDGHSVLVLSLEMVIELKKSSTRPKDQLMVPILEETLRRR